MCSPDTDKIHLKTRLAHVFGGLPDISWGIQTANISYKLPLSHPVDKSSQGKLNHTMVSSQVIVIIRVSFSGLFEGSFLFCFSDWGDLKCPEEAVICRGRVCDRTSHIMGSAAAGGQTPHIWCGEDIKDYMGCFLYFFSAVISRILKYYVLKWI